MSAADYYQKHGINIDAEAHAGGYLPMFHGTGSMEAYRNIVFQGNIPSGHEANAGEGVYAVDAGHLDFAKSWRGEKTYVVQLKLDPRAVLVDISEGPGKEAFEATLAKILADINRCAPGANAATKRLLLASRTRPLEPLLDDAADAFARALRSAEGREGVTAFLEKRPAGWVDKAG